MGQNVRLDVLIVVQSTRTVVTNGKMRTPATYQQTLHRFWDKVDFSKTCWIWTDVLNSKGYGMFGLGKKVYPAHRISYELLKGYIPEGYQIHHQCGNKACVNPEHLEPVTPSQNIRLGDSPPSRNAKKTHCPKGHSYSGENLAYDNDGSRVCKLCRKTRTSKWIKDNKERHNKIFNEWIISNKDHLRKYRYNYYKNKREQLKNITPI